jgi:membrane protein DedA with SNARE-associated domain
MPFWRFTIYTVLGCIPWVLLLTWAGVKAGENWEDVKHWLEYVDYLVAVGIVGVVVWLVVRSRRGRNNSEPGSDVATS